MKSVPFGLAAAPHRVRAAFLFLGAGLVITACGDGGTSAPATPPAPAPSPPPALPAPLQTPEGVGVTAVGLDFIEWSWNPVVGASGYEVQFGTNGAVTDEAPTIPRTGDETAWRAEDLESETLYSFRVRSFSGEGAGRLVSDWSDPRAAEIGQFLDVVTSEVEDGDDLDLSELPPDLAAKVEAFFEYVSGAAFTSRGLPHPEAGVSFGCRTTQVLGGQLDDWTNGILLVVLALLELELAVTLGDAEDLDLLDAAMAQARGLLDRTLDGLVANLREGRCGLFSQGDAFVWEREEGLVSITLPDEDGGAGASLPVPVIRILGAAATFNSASGSTEVGAWWVPRDLTSLAEVIGPEVLSTLPLGLPPGPRAARY